MYLMRLILRFTPTEYALFNKINKHSIQGLLYYSLSGTKYENLHSKKGYKFFTFSDIFPATDFSPEKDYSLIISSPRKGLINEWYNKFSKMKYIYLSDLSFKIKEIKKIQVGVEKSLITGSPIVLYEDSKKNRYFSFRRNGNVDFFLKRLKENALKKFNAFYNDDFLLEGPIFDRFSLKKEVSVKVTIGTQKFDIIGSMWNLLEKTHMEKDEIKFYNFIMDAGLGEKNSLGFGFVNPVKIVGDGSHD